MPDMNGIDFTRVTKQLFPWLPVLVITGYGNVQLAIRTIQAGAEDFLEKPFNIEILLEKVKSIIQKNSNENYFLFSSLTTMERQILGLISSGKNNKDIAYFLKRSRRTIENHRAHLMKKFDAHNIEELIRNASLSGRVRQEVRLDQISLEK
jgi:two-component system, LuxR family, response regulator FixJ